MEEITNRALLWLYEIVNIKTGEHRIVFSRKFVDELAPNLRCFYFLRCVGVYDSDGVFWSY